MTIRIAFRIVDHLSLFASHISHVIYHGYLTSVKGDTLNNLEVNRPDGSAKNGPSISETRVYHKYQAVCTYIIHVHTYIQTDRQTDRQAYRQTDRQTDRQVIPMYTLYTCASIRIHTYISIHPSIHPYVHVLYIHAHTHTPNTHAHTRIQIYIHTYLQYIIHAHLQSYRLPGVIRMADIGHTSILPMALAQGQ